METQAVLLPAMSQIASLSLNSLKYSAMASTHFNLIKATHIFTRKIFSVKSHAKITDKISSGKRREVVITQQWCKGARLTEHGESWWEANSLSLDSLWWSE